jgi:hypothetical protein
MLYNQPFDKPPEVTYGDTPYVNGNPATGQPGSIPSAASIEYPQREIVNLIRSSPLAPSNSDLQQLARALQSGAIWFGIDQGTANAYQVTLNPPPLALYPGMSVLVKIGNTNTGASVLNVNAIGAAPIIHHDGTAASPSDMLSGAFELFVYTGIAWELAWKASASGLVYLTANLDYYINTNTGNDAYDGLSATFSSGIHGPFKTLQHASDQVPLYNLNNHQINMHVADGAYDSMIGRRINGVGGVYWQGNSVSPQNVTVFTTNKSSFILNSLGGTYYFDGFRLSCTGSAVGDQMCLVNVYGSTSSVLLGSIDFGPTQGAHISTQNGSVVTNLNPGSPWRIYGSAPGSSTENGSFVFAYAGGQCINNSGGGPTISVLNAITLAGSFIQVNYNCFVQLLLAGGVVTGAANVTGTRFFVDNNSEILTGGAGINYYPGTIAGVQGAHGGYYT